MSAAERVFSLPEIAELIIEQLEFDRAALYAAHLVNTTWAYHARKVLWRNAPLSALTVVEPCKQQYYANMIQTSSTWDEWWPAELDKLSFPSLKRFLFNFKAFFEVAQCRRLLPPFLKASSQYLDLWLECENNPRTDIRTCQRNRLEDRLRSRRAPAKSLPMDKVAEIMCHPDFRNNCEELFMWELWLPKKKLIASLLATTSYRPIFPNVKHFGAHIPYQIGDYPPSVQLPALLPSTLLSFHLDIGDPEPWFDVLSQFTALQSLTIVTLNDIDDINSIALLGRLHDLRSLVIERCNTDYQFGWKETWGVACEDSDFEAMTSGLALLQYLELSMPYELSLPALTSLATHCPRLKTCILSLSVPIGGWGAQQAPDFPHLETLILTQGEYVDLFGGTDHETKWSSPKTQSRPTMEMVDESLADPTHVDIVLRHCPRLVKLHLYLKDYGRKEIEEISKRMA